MSPRLIFCEQTKSSTGSSFLRVVAFCRRSEPFCLSIVSYFTNLVISPSADACPRLFQGYISVFYMG